MAVSTDQPVTSIWQLKPWWCQPWSILATGIAVVLASWLLLHRIWLSVAVAVPVALWWLLFLVVVPAAWASQAHQQD